ncbi:predicted protein [Arabidopsis lyrata subsp. lyrata]|uniref:Predicted protein n=1 Tax=Arabidopsis lyrata subsp. lyrata TaxID=81972 RepID=D7LMF6_ARALL|nr:predicted protein [Arabidopsis lyrata subsp. lyrata]
MEIYPGIDEFCGEACETTKEAENPGGRRKPDRVEIRKGRRDGDGLFTLPRRHTTLILALDLHTEEFRDVPFRNLPSRPRSLAITDQLVNFDDRSHIHNPF